MFKGATIAIKGSE